MYEDPKQHLALSTKQEMAFLQATILDRDKEITELKSALETEISHVLNMEKNSRLEGLEHTNKLAALQKDLDKAMEENKNFKTVN